MNKRITKIISIMILVITLATIACSCNTDDLSNTEDGYKFLVVSSEETTESNSSFANASEHGFHIHFEKNIIDDVKSTVKSPFTSKNIEYRYSNCSKVKKDSETKTIGDFYSIYDVYDTDQENLIYLHGTNLLCQYFYSGNDNSVSNKTLTHSEALNISNAFLLKFLSEEQIAKFETPTIEEGPSKVFMYTITYVRKIAGFDTDETIKTFISFSGKVVGYNGMNLNKYDGYIDTITEKSVVAAKNALESKVNSLGLKEASLGSPTVTTNAYGELFLKLRVTYTNDEGFQSVNEYLINILS